MKPIAPHAIAPARSRRHLLRTGLALGAWMTWPAARACEFDTINFVIVHPWTRASEPGATTAAVSMNFVNVTRADRLIGVRTPIAEAAEMGGDGVPPSLDFEIPVGPSTALREDGPHLRLLGLKQPLLVGREFPMTLIFASAGTVPARLSVDYARFR